MPFVFHFQQTKSHHIVFFSLALNVVHVYLIRNFSLFSNDFALKNSRYHSRLHFINIIVVVSVHVRLNKSHDKRLFWRTWVCTVFFFFFFFVRPDDLQSCCGHYTVRALSLSAYSSSCSFVIYPTINYLKLVRIPFNWNKITVNVDKIEIKRRKIVSILFSDKEDTHTHTPPTSIHFRKYFMRFSYQSSAQGHSRFYFKTISSNFSSQEPTVASNEYPMNEHAHSSFERSLSHFILFFFSLPLEL